jgi:hypothetical protein
VGSTVSIDGESYDHVSAVDFNNNLTVAYRITKLRFVELAASVMGSTQLVSMLAVSMTHD